MIQNVNLVTFFLCLSSMATARSDPPTPPNSDAPVDQNSAEQFFIADAAKVSRLSREISLMAMTHAQDAEVKTYAKTLIEFHDKFSVELKDLAAAMRQTIPAKLDEADQKELDAMRKLHGPAFDRRFSANMVTLQNKGVHWFQSAADRGTDAKLKKVAEQSLTTIKEHAAGAVKLRESIEAKQDSPPKAPQSQPSGTPKKDEKPGPSDKPAGPEKP